MSSSLPKHSCTKPHPALTALFKDLWYSVITPSSPPRTHAFKPWTQEHVLCLSNVGNAAPCTFASAAARTRSVGHTKATICSGTGNYPLRPHHRMLHRWSSPATLFGKFLVGSAPYHVALGSEVPRPCMPILVVTRAFSGRTSRDSRATIFWETSLASTTEGPWTTCLVRSASYRRF